MLLFSYTFHIFKVLVFQYNIFHAFFLISFFNVIKKQILQSDL